MPLVGFIVLKIAVITKREIRDATVTINPHDKECEIETEDNVWHSVEEMEAEKSEQFQKENAEADPEK